MTSWAETIIVEGESDARFVGQYLEHCPAFAHLKERVVIGEGDAASPLDAIRILRTAEHKAEGGNETTLFAEKGGLRTFKKAVANSEKTLVLLDADEIPGDRRKSFVSRVKEHANARKAESVHLFLVPDGGGKGALEDLLLRIARDSDAVAAVEECFDKRLVACLSEFCKSAGIPESRLPRVKQKFYVYCAIVLGVTPQECDFDDTLRWDLESPALDPLRDFLTAHLPPPQNAAPTKG